MTQRDSLVSELSSVTRPAQYRLSDIVGVSRVFARSINIKRDFRPEEDTKVAGYVPTNPAEECLKAIAESTRPLAEERARLIFGPYGGGKSNLGLVIARLMRSGAAYPALKPVLDRIEAGPRPAIQRLILDRWSELEQSGPTNYLTVLLHGNEGPFRDAMLDALSRTLDAEGLSDILPRTSFRAAIERIRRWRREHETAYREFEAELVRRGETVEGLERQLRAHSSEAYRRFCELHPRVAAGTEFRSADLSRADEVYLETAVQLQRRGFAGIFVVWDEFGTYFDEAARLIKSQGNSSELKGVEQFAEVCHSSRATQVHFLALAHRSLIEYAEMAQLGRQAADEWKRISGRFHSLNLAAGSQDRHVYSVLERVVSHSDRWSVFADDGGRSAIESAATDAVRHRLYDWQLEDVKRMAMRCYPLHPATAYALPRLSNAIAQNERTLFTYASYEESGAMPDFIRSAPPFSAQEPVFVPVDAMFEYFEEAIKVERPNTWDQYTLALYEAGGAGAPAMDRRLLQVMAIWDCVRTSVISLSADVARHALALRTQDEQDAFSEAAERLQSLGIIYERSDKVLLFAGSQRQTIQKELQEEIRRLERPHDSLTFLREQTGKLTSTVLQIRSFEPMAYIRRHKTQRTLQAAVIGPRLDQATRAIMSECRRSPNASEGYICYVACSSEQDIAQARELAQKELRHDRVLVVIPPQPLDIKEHTLRLEALLALRLRAPYNDRRSGAGQMIDDYIKVATRRLEDQVRPLYSISYGGLRSEVWREGSKVTEIDSIDDIEDYASKLFEKSYEYSIPIDDENLSTRPLSRQQYGGSGRTRRAVIAAILRFGALARRERQFLGFGNTSAEHRYVRSFLVAGGFLYQAMSTWEVGRPRAEVYKPGAAVYDVVDEWFFSPQFDGVRRPVRTLVERLGRPPYGLYSPVIALALAVVVRDRSGQLQFFKDDKPILDREMPLPDVIDALAYEPGSFSVVCRAVSVEVRAFANILLSALSRPRLSPQADPIAESAAALKRWADSLGTYAKRTARLSDSARSLRDLALAEGTDPFQLVAVDLPSQLGLADAVQASKGLEENLTEVGESLARAIAEVEECHLQVDDRVMEVAASVFGVESESPTTIFEAMKSDVDSRVDRADPAALSAVRSQIWEFQRWLGEQHPIPREAFGELGLRLANRSNRSVWADTDLELVRARLTVIWDIVQKLAGRPEPPSTKQLQFLAMLCASLGAGGEAVQSATDPVSAAASACRSWYDGLSPYAQQTKTLPEDARALRDGARTAPTSPRQILLEILPQRLRLEQDIASLDSEESAGRIRFRLNTLAGRIAGVVLKVDEEVARVLRAAFSIDGRDAQHVLQEVRSQVETKVLAAGGANGSQRITRLRTLLQTDAPASEVFRSLGALYVPGKALDRWDDQDVAFARMQIQEAAKDVLALTPIDAKAQRRVRVVVMINGAQTSADVLANELVEQFAASTTDALRQWLSRSDTRDDAKTIALANVLQSMLERQAQQKRRRGR